MSESESGDDSGVEVEKKPYGEPTSEDEPCGFYSQGEFCGDDADRVRELEYVGHTVTVYVCDDHNWASFDLKKRTFPMAVPLSVYRQFPQRAGRDQYQYTAHVGKRVEPKHEERLNDDALSNLMADLREQYDYETLPVGEKGYAVFHSPTDYELVEFDPEAGRPVVEWQAERAAEALAAIPEDAVSGTATEDAHEGALQLCAQLADVDYDDLRATYRDDPEGEPCQ